MNESTTLFDLPYQAQRDARDESLRLGGQVRHIYDRLRAGPATNADLAAISLKYTGRLSDLRKALKPAGCTVECFDQNAKTGVCWYRLVRLSEVER